MPLHFANFSLHLLLPEFNSHFTLICLFDFICASELFYCHTVIADPLTDNYLIFLSLILSLKLVGNSLKIERLRYNSPK